MKLKLITLAILPITLAACQTSELQKAGDLAVSVLQQQNADQTLAAYQWQANPQNAPQAITLNFTADKKLSIHTSCNTLFGGFELKNNTIVAAQLASTMKGCNGLAAEQERFAGNLFSQAAVPFVLNLNDRDNPTLTLVQPNGEKIIFTGKMTPETKYKTQGETIFLEISPETKQCTGVTPQTCLQVREIKYNDSGIKTQVDKDWTLFYDQIEGFSHSPNERQIIRVKRYEIKNPAADQSKYAYIFDMAVEREAVKGSL
ncbi:META and DUF4377 domain-containing protein [Acinetobacter sp. DSM 11652]|uniref:META and DUF4377 domain-containing protein n=1 Tax=Acinetobacter sp. DSM 11652 TaxID=346222 RepID=UPI0008C82B82|nr:META and DUF4377 domain-containing protein [Acinetobacter sp. DSM 11652]SEL74832.1 Heat shock protein HslJ [Acinetobacter sp. DSM 11652]